MSLPTSADVSVNCVPASCIPSPLSPQKRIVTDGSVVTCLPLPLLLPFSAGDRCPDTESADSVVRLIWAFAHFRKIRSRPLPRLLGLVGGGRVVVDVCREVL